MSHLTMLVVNAINSLHHTPRSPYLQKDDSLETQEICTQYNMLKLARSLFRCGLRAVTRPKGYQQLITAQSTYFSGWRLPAHLLHHDRFSYTTLMTPPHSPQVDRGCRHGGFL